jgi:hypothetical protein
MHVKHGMRLYRTHGMPTVKRLCMVVLIRCTSRGRMKVHGLLSCVCLQLCGALQLCWFHEASLVVLYDPPAERAIQPLECLYVLATFSHVGSAHARKVREATAIRQAGQPSCCWLTRCIWDDQISMRVRQDTHLPGCALPMLQMSATRCFMSGWC